MLGDEGLVEGLYPSFLLGLDSGLLTSGLLGLLDGLVDGLVSPLLVLPLFPES